MSSTPVPVLAQSPSYSTKKGEEKKDISLKYLDRHRARLIQFISVEKWFWKIIQGVYEQGSCNSQMKYTGTKNTLFNGVIWTGV